MNFLQVPFAHWSRLRHVLSVALVGLAVLVMCLLWDAREANLLVRAQAQLDDAQKALRQDNADRMREVSADVTKSLQDALPSPVILDQVQADISRFAEELHLQLVSMVTEHPSVTAQDVSRIGFQVIVRGDYQGIKSWLSELLARYPTLALQQLQIQAATQDPAMGVRQEARVTLVLYVRYH